MVLRSPPRLNLSIWGFVIDTATLITDQLPTPSAVNFDHEITEHHMLSGF